MEKGMEKGKNIIMGNQFMKENSHMETEKEKEKNILTVY